MTTQRCNDGLPDRLWRPEGVVANRSSSGSSTRPAMATLPSLCSPGLSRLPHRPGRALHLKALLFLSLYREQQREQLFSLPLSLRQLWYDLDPLFDYFHLEALIDWVGSDRCQLDGLSPTAIFDEPSIGQRCKPRWKRREGRGRWRSCDRCAATRAFTFGRYRFCVESGGPDRTK